MLKSKRSTVAILLSVSLAGAMYTNSLYRISELNIANENLDTKVIEKTNQIASANIDIAKLSTEIDKKNSSIAELDNTNKDLSERLEESKSNNTKLRKELESEKSKVKVTRGSANTNTNSGNKGEYKSFEITGYCPCPKCCGQWSGAPTASGVMPKANRTIAVDTSIIPMGSKVEIEGLGVFTAEDTGSAVVGNVIDIYHNTHSEARKIGRQKVKARIIK